MATRPGRRRRDIQNCRRKVAYENLREARKAARLVRQLIHELVLAYPCPIPGNHHAHIGHPDLLDSERPKRKRKR